MNKTPEEIAEEWASSRWYAKHDPTVSGESKAAFLAGYQAAQQWISVKERLPEIGEDKYNNHPHIYKYDQSERVLVLFRDCDIDDERVCIGRFISVLRDIESSRPEQWVECDAEGSAELKDIVAWMPLPAAPKEEA